jgi:hypothetical protein
VQETDDVVAASAYVIGGTLEWARCVCRR